MNKKYSQIKDSYEEFSRELMRKGKLPLRDTGIGYWSIAVCDEMYDLFKKMQLEKYPNFIDLGSGDGRVALIASLFTRAEGIEYDKDLFNKSLEISNKHKLDVTFHNKDFLEHDLSPYSVIFIHPDQNISRKLEAKLLREMTGKLVVHGPMHHPAVLRKTEEHDVNGLLCSVWEK